MSRRRLPLFWIVVAFAIADAGDALARQPQSKVDFSRQVRPILAQHCFACHGPDDDSREAGLRLDGRTAALAELDSGATAIVPGDPDRSALVERIESLDADLRMPPQSSGHVLNVEQISTLRAWIAQGAAYDEHWSFRPVAAAPLPTVRDTAWPRNAIDYFVLSRLEQEGLRPSPEADRATLIRRLSLDLLGLPPEVDDVDRFVAETAPDAYERLVDRLLASPHFGERWGRHWLDMARYADSDGYLGDALRSYAWLYRDWVIDAINRDMPFDRFTIEQLAGDLLPGATVAERTATGFLRNSLRNTEAGVDKEEYRVKEVVDRVSTIGVVWLGLSAGCAECHSHKYDPISQREFYQLFAFFNDADDVEVPAPLPGEMEQYRQRRQSWQQRQAGLASAMQAALARRADLVPGADAAALQAALATASSQRSPQQRQWLEELDRRADGPLREICDHIQKHATAEPQPPTTKAMAVAARKSERPTYVHLRGDYRHRGQQVQPGTLGALHPFQPRSDRPDRLDLARWLVDPANPLVRRVTVNHLWRPLFGQALVTTVDDFGVNGAAPSHPELLDWLAEELARQNWSRKAIVRLIVTSATYRQVSHARADLSQRDPLATLLARQGRFRLEAEVVRDAALAASGLLTRRVGGPSFRPPQPAYVTAISRNADWKVSTGAERYRRGMYVLFRRATPYPMLLAFDAPDSTVACTRRERSNSPLQALTLLNDPVFFECAQALAARVVDHQPATTDERIRRGFRLCLSRQPHAQELERLRALYQHQRARLAADPGAAQAIAPQQVQPAHAVELATWVVVARVLMNLDEFITRE